jgi:hypothetical protein
MVCDSAHDSCKYWRSGTDLSLIYLLMHIIVIEVHVCYFHQAACIVRVPVEVVKQRRQTTALHLTAITVARRAVASEGLKGLYRGFGSTLLREVPFSIIQFSLWEALKYQWAVSNNLQQTDPLATSLCGALAGTVRKG